MSRALAKLSLRINKLRESVSVKAYENLRYNFNQLVTADLSFGLENVVVDKPGLNLGIGPSAVNLVR